MMELIGGGEKKEMCKSNFTCAAKPFYLQFEKAIYSDYYPCPTSFTLDLIIHV